MEHVDLEKVFQKTPSEKEFDKMKLPPRKESDTFLDPFMGIRSDQATLDQFQKRKSSGNFSFSFSYKKNYLFILYYNILHFINF